MDRGATLYYIYDLRHYGSFFFFQAEDGIRDLTVTGVQTCALPIWPLPPAQKPSRPPMSPMPGTWQMPPAATAGEAGCAVSPLPSGDRAASSTAVLACAVAVIARAGTAAACAGPAVARTGVAAACVTA